MRNFWQATFLGWIITIPLYGNSIPLKNTCGVNCPLKDGFYLGVAAGLDAYTMKDAPSSNASYFGDEAALGVSAQPDISVVGIVGGIFLGYGVYFPQYYNSYLGFEIFANGSAADASYNWQSQFWTNYNLILHKPLY